MKEGGCKRERVRKGGGGDEEVNEAVYEEY